MGADINDAFASRMPLMGAVGGPTIEVHHDARPVASQPVVLSPMNHVPTPHHHPAPPGVPLATADPLSAPQHASSAHTPFYPEPAPFVYAQPQQAAEPRKAQGDGYLDALAARRKDVLKLTILALMITLGIGLHALLSHYTNAWIEAGQFTAKQEFLARLIYPLGVLFALWNLKALQ